MQGQATDADRERLADALLYVMYVAEQAEKRKLVRQSGGPRLTSEGRAKAERMFAENRKPTRADILAVSGIDMGLDWDAAP